MGVRMADMAYVVCPKHGGSGASAVCEHVHRKVIGGDSSVEPLFPVRSFYEGSTIGPTWLCSLCAKRYGVPAEGMILDGEAGLERYVMEIGWWPVCPRCFKETFNQWMD